MFNIPDIWKKRLVPGSEALLEEWLTGADIQFRLSRARTTKHGDFRIPPEGKRAVITLNHDMHPVEFLITLAHEVAHFRVWKKYGRRARPHGEEWKTEFRVMLKQIIESGILDPKVSKAVVQCYFKRERIGSGACEAMYRALGLAGEESGVTRLADLPEGALFTLKNGRSFFKGEKMRNRYRCREKISGRIYSVHAMAEIQESLVI
jgi:SprT protein